MKANSGELNSVAASDSPRRKSNTSKESVSVDPSIREWFESDFWPLYPRHEGKQPALKAANAKATTPEKRAFYLARLKSQLPTATFPAKRILGTATNLSRPYGRKTSQQRIDSIRP
jgi:hypothetical protein